MVGGGEIGEREESPGWDISQRKRENAFQEDGILRADPVGEGGNTRDDESSLPCSETL